MVRYVIFLGLKEHMLYNIDNAIIIQLKAMYGIHWLVSGLGLKNDNSCALANVTGIYQIV